MYSSHQGLLDPGLQDSLLRCSFFTFTDRIIFPSANAQFHIKMMHNDMWFYNDIPEVRYSENTQYLNINVC